MSPRRKCRYCHALFDARNRLQKACLKPSCQKRRRHDTNRANYRTHRYDRDYGWEKRKIWQQTNGRDFMRHYRQENPRYVEKNRRQQQIRDRKKKNLVKSDLGKRRIRCCRSGAMKQHPEQLHRRMTWSTVWNVVGEFAIKRMAAQVSCQWLSISRAQLYRLCERWFRLRNEKKISKDWFYQRPLTGESRLPPDVQDFLKEECRYLKEQSTLFQGHFNFSLIAEQCHRKFGKRYSRHTLRRWIISQGLFDPKTDTTSKAYVCFETGGIGMLFQHDSSKHLWVPATQRNDILIATIDDHSRKLVAAKLVPRDSTWHHMSVVRETIERYGCPLAYYVDNYSVFRPDKEPYTQFGRALKAVGIDLKFTGVRQGQAKGKIEKKFDYLQRRIPYLCERYHIKNLTQANKIVLPEVINYYNELHVHHETPEIPDQRWNKALKDNRSYLRPLPKKVSLDFHFALHYKRTLKKDGHFGFGGQMFKVPNAPRRAKVTLVLLPPMGPRRPHSVLSVHLNGSTLVQFILPKRSPLTEKGESHGAA